MAPALKLSLLVVMALMACKSTDKSQDAGAAASASQAPQNAEGPSREAFEAQRTQFEVCDKKRLRAIYDMGAKSSEDAAKGRSQLGESRQCLEAWWKEMDGILEKQNIPRTVWMKHFEVWSKETKKYPLPTPKPFEKGTRVTMPGAIAHTKLTITVPSQWKRKKLGDDPKERIDFGFGDLDAYLINTYQSDAEPVARHLQFFLSSQDTIHAQEYTVDGVKGVLWFYKPSAPYVGMQWSVHDDIKDDGYGYKIAFDMKYNTPALSDEQKQLFLDILASMKLSKK